jgi:hypothetical protein
MARKVVISGYLTEAKLTAALKVIVGDRWGGSQLVLPGSRRRWDIWFTGVNGRVLVEFDGDEHYRNTLKIKADAEKDTFASAQGLHLVRIPYWVQLDTLTLSHYFGLDADIEQDFPHGFVTTKIFPASFCEMGITRFRRELDALPVPVRAAVVGSLRDRAEEHGLEHVVPSGLRDVSLR